MTKPLPDGAVVDRTYSDLEEVSRQNMNKLMAALIDLKNGGDNDTAFNITLELFNDEAERRRIMTLLIHKRVNDAELAAQRLAAADKAAIDKEQVKR